jgi:predicted transcriptional regulator
MSKMADLCLEIQLMLEDNVHPTSIAKRLDVPLSWVYDTLEQMEPSEEELSPFATLNS